MQIVTHKVFGKGQIINRVENGNSIQIDVKFERNGMEKTFSLPKSFEDGFLTAEGDLKKEIDAIIENRKNADKAKREAMEQAVADARKTTSSSGKRKNSSTPTVSWQTLVSASDRTVKKEYETYLIDNGYAEFTPKGAESTVSQYVKRVNDVLEREHLTWSSLENHISNLLSLYGKGGAKEDFGNIQHQTVIYALKAFDKFING